MKPFRYRPPSPTSGKGNGPDGSHGIQRPSHTHNSRPITAPGPSTSTAAPSAMNAEPSNQSTLSARPAFNRAHSSGPAPGVSSPLPMLKAATTSNNTGLTPATSSASLRTEASEAWTSPEESEGEFVRRTYLYFDLYGVQDDGTSEGKEWTRNRDAAKTPWNELREVGDATLAPTTTNGHRSRAKSNPNAPAGRQRPSSARSDLNGRLSPSSSPHINGKNAARLNATSRSSPLAMPPTVPGQSNEEVSSDTVIAGSSTNGHLNTNSEATPNLTTPSNTTASESSRLPTPHHNATNADPARLQSAMLAPITMQSRRSESELSEVSEIGTEEWAEHRETERRKRKDLSSHKFGGIGGTLGEEGQPSDVDGNWKMLDRYGFFSQEWASQHGRISILPGAAYNFVPTPGAPKKGKRSAAFSAHVAQNVLKEDERELAQAQKSSSLPEEPSGGPPSGSSSHQNGNASAQADVISSIRTRGNGITRQREQGRIAKWGSMLEPADKAGGNTSFFRVKAEFAGSSKLLQRVFKGIPDRWRAAAWWALLELDKNKGASETSETPSSVPAIKGKSTEKPAVQDEALSSPTVNSSLKKTSTKRKGPKSKSSEKQPATATTTDGANALASPTKTRRKKDRTEPLGVAIQRRKRQDHTSRYHRLLGVASPHDVQIDLDVPRTISNHIQFHTRYGQGQRSLFKVLHCFSLLCQDCGYCQGMGSLTVTLLCYFPEEVAYSVLVSLHDSPTKFDLHTVFYPGFPGLMEQFHVQEHLMRLLLPPDLLLNLETEGITTSSYATRWYITKFYNVVPFETQLRLWDVYFFLGRDVLPLFAVAILYGLSMTTFKGPERNYDFEHLMSHLNHFYVPESDDCLFRWIGQLVVNKKIGSEIEKARRQWKDMQSGGGGERGGQ